MIYVECFLLSEKARAYISIVILWLCPLFYDLLLQAEWGVLVVATEYRLTGNVQYSFASPWVHLQVFSEQLE